MSRISPQKRTKVLRVLKSNGFEYARQGAHGKIHVRPSTGDWTTLPDHTEIGPEMLRRIIRQTQKHRREFGF